MRRAVTRDVLCMFAEVFYEILMYTDVYIYISINEYIHVYMIYYDIDVYYIIIYIYLNDICIIPYHMCDRQNSIHVVRSWHRFTRPPIATHSPSTLFTN